MRLAVIDTERCIGCQSCMFACVRRQGAAGLGLSCIGIRSIGGTERGFVVIICKSCKNPPCAKVCPSDALIPMNEGGVRLDSSKCIGCGNCVDACILGAVFWDDANNKPLICIHCGYCAKYCPHGVIKLEGTKQENLHATE